MPESSTTPAVPVHPAAPTVPVDADPLPLDARALLLTDLVDSTRLSEQIGDAAMAQVWAAHDRLARDLLPALNGLEIDKTDGMLLMFDSAADALHYALAYHAGLAGLAAALPFALPWPLQARAGLHVGPVILRRNAAADVARGAKPLEVDGMAKPTAARVMSVAQGGQTLLTAEARDAVGAALSGLGTAAPAGQGGLSLQAHGHWRLKGVATPVALFEAGPDPAAFSAPPDSDKACRVVCIDGRWLPVREVPNNLPNQVSSFVGRERELDELKALLADHRLVTLLGMGGLGKTRLSLQVAAELRAEFPDGTWFVDLSPLRDGALVASETAQVLGLREEPGRSLLQTLGSHLATRRALLVFDNCEHLIQAAASLAHGLVRAAPGVRLMASSREPLHVPGEQVYPVHPLPMPARGAGLAQLQASAAVRLFVERAQAHKAGWLLSAAEAPAVADLVQRLEGIPLALELAAARVRTLSVADINKRLNDRYKLLTGGSRVLQQRQQTLRALVDWSYDLLSEAEQLLFQRLGVFIGGFDLAAAETVCAGEALDSLDILDLLGSLVDKSLVLSGSQDAETRYRMLDTLREYAYGKLCTSAVGDSTGTAARHAQFYFALAKLGRDGMQGPQQRAWLDRLDFEQDNLRAAMATAQRPGSGVDAFVALKMAVALQNFWIMHGGASEGRGVVRVMLAHPAVIASAVARAHALYVGAALALTQGDLPEALDMLQSCLQLRREAGAPVEVAATLSTLAVTMLGSGDMHGARVAGTEAVGLFRGCGYRVGEAIGLVQLGEVETHRADFDAARAHLQVALALAVELKHPETEGEAELALGDVEAETGQPAAAALHYQRSLTVCTAAGDRRGAAHARWALGRLALRACQWSVPLPLLRGALADFDDLDMRGPWLGCIEDLAELALAAQDARRAAGLAAAAQGLRTSAHLARSPQADARLLQVRSRLQATLSATDLALIETEALQWEAQEIRRQALAVEAPAGPEQPRTQGPARP